MGLIEGFSCQLISQQQGYNKGSKKPVVDAFGSPAVFIASKKGGIDLFQPMD